MSENAVFFKVIIGLVTIGVYVINLVKLFSTALSDQIGLAIIHGVGLIGPLCLITVWF